MTSLRKILLAAAGLAVLSAGSASAEPVKIRISWAVAPAHMTPLLPEAPKGVYKHWGKSYVVEPIRIAGSGPALQALAAGEIEMGGLSPQSLVLGVARAKVDLQAVAQLMSSGVNGYGSSDFFVRKGEIKKLEDLKGKVVAVNALGSSIDAAVQAQLSKAGMRPNTDYQVVEVGFNNMMASLEGKRVDLAVILLPQSLTASKKGTLEVLFSMTDALGPNETLQWIGKDDWLKKNRAVVIDFLEDNLRFRQWLLDPKNRKEALAIVSKVTKVPADQYEDWLFTKEDNYRDPMARPHAARMQKNVDDLYKLKILEDTIQVAKHVDTSYVEEAAKRLK
jgi:NitT/TauT family transport system substrate-binding protein